MAIHNFNTVNITTKLDVEGAGNFYYDNVSVTATAAELNILDTVTATAAELNYLDITTLGTGAASKAVVLDSGDDYTWPAAGLLTYGGTAINASGAEINAAADVSARLVNVGDVDTHVVLTTDSGKLHAIGLVTGNLAVTMPTPAVGLEYRFMFVGTAAEDDNWIITATSDFVGGVGHLDTDGELNDSIAADGSSKNTLTVITPGAGTLITMISDGTNWFTSGPVFSATAPTFTDV